MWIKALIAGVDRIIHGGKHFPVIDDVANVPQEVRDDLVGHTHFEDATHEIAPETQEAVIKATEEANSFASTIVELAKQPEQPEVEKPAEKPSEPPADAAKGKAKAK